MMMKKFAGISILIILGSVSGAILAPPGQALQQAVYLALLGLYFGIMFQRTPMVSIKSSFLGWILGGMLVGFLLGVAIHQTIIEIIFLSIQVATAGFILAVVDNLLRPWR
jgi:hypothetical protein